MASNVSTTDGLGFEEVNQMSSTENISGTNIYATYISGANMDIQNFVSDLISGATISGTSARVTNYYGTGAYITTISGTTISGTTFKFGVGSTTDLSATTASGTTFKFGVGSCTDFSSALISGTNIYGDLYGNTISGATISGTTYLGTVGSIVDVRVNHLVAVGSIAANEYFGKVNDSTGNPIVSNYFMSGTSASGGAAIIGGVGTLSAGSDGWIIFGDGNVYDVAPSVVVTNTKSDAGIWLPVGSITAGSAYVLGSLASDTYNWISLGIL
jgi:hypothetical protein